MDIRLNIIFILLSQPSGPSDSELFCVVKAVEFKAALLKRYCMQRISGQTDGDGALLRLGHVIRRERKALNLSQEAFADEVGIDRAHMGRIERGERNVTFLNLLRIAKALGKLPSSILTQADL